MFGLFMNDKTSQQIGAEIAQEASQDRMLILLAHNMSNHINASDDIDREELYFIINDAQSLVYHMKKAGKKELTYKNITFKLDANDLLDYEVN